MLIPLVPLPGHAVGLADLEVTPRGPIIIRGDGDLCHPTLGGASSGVRNCDVADGSADRPYRISGWRIEGAGLVGGTPFELGPYGIQLHDTSRHVIVERNEIDPYPSSAGILLFDATPVTVSENVVRGRNSGLLELYHDKNAATAETRVLGNDFDLVRNDLGSGLGIRLSSGRGQVLDNQVRVTGPSPSSSVGLSIGGAEFAVDGNRFKGDFAQAFALVGSAVAAGAGAALAGFGHSNFLNEEQLVVLRGESRATHDFSKLPAKLLAAIDSDNPSLLNVDAPDHPVYLENVRDVRIEHGRFGGWDGLVGGADGALGIARGERVTVSDCLLDSALEEGISVYRSVDVTLERCSIVGRDTSNPWITHLTTGAASIACLQSSGLTVRDSTVRDWHWRGSGLSAYQCPGLLIQNNRFADKRAEDVPLVPGKEHPDAYPKPYSISVGHSTDVRITGNQFLGRTADPNMFATNAIFALNSKGLRMDGNAFDSLDGYGVTLFQTTDVSFARNLVAQSGLAGLFVSGNAEQVEILQNEFRGNEVAVDVGGTLPWPQPLTSLVTAHHNDFYGNRVALHAQPGAQPVDARRNWWGDATGPSGAGPGKGDSVDADPGATVLLDPWLKEPVA